MIEANNIRNINHVRQILDNLKEYIHSYKIQFGELSENAYVNIRFQLCEIDEFIIGIQKCDERNFADSDLRLFSYYEYLNDDCSFDELVENLRRFEGEV